MVKALELPWPRGPGRPGCRWMSVSERSLTQCDGVEPVGLTDAVDEPQGR